MNKKATATTIINAAKEEYQKRGYTATDPRHIFNAAGVSKSEYEAHVSSPEDCCLQVLKSYSKELKQTFRKYDENENCRQRLSLFLDDLHEKAESYASEGHPIFNLYYDVRNMDGELSEQAAETLEMIHEWLDEQFIIMLKTEAAVDQGDRLMAAVSGLLLLVKVTGDAQMFKSQIIQLRSWIRSM